MKLRAVRARLSKMFVNDHELVKVTARQLMVPSGAACSRRSSIVVGIREGSTSQARPRSEVDRFLVEEFETTTPRMRTRLRVPSSNSLGAMRILTSC